MVGRIKRLPKSLRRINLKSIFSFAAALLVIISIATTLPIFQYSEAQAISSVDAESGASSGESLVTQNNDNPNWLVQSESYVDAIQACFENSELSTSDHWYTTAKDTRITYNDAKNGNWFGSKDKDKSIYANTVMIGNYMKDSPISNDSKYGDKIKAAKWDGKVWCNNQYLVSSALSLWGLDPITVLCNIGFTRYSNGTAAGDDVSSCENASSDFDFEYTDKSGGDSGSGGVVANNFVNYILKTVYGGTNVDSFPHPQKTDSTAQQDIVGARWYLFYRHTLNESCIPGIDTKAPSSNLSGGNHLYNGVVWVDDSGSKAPGSQYIGSSSYNTWDTVGVGPVINGGNAGQADYKCSKVVDLMNSYADQYAAWIKDAAKTGSTVDNTVGGGSTGVDCTKNPSDPKCPTTATTCGIGGIGWIVCPVLKFMGDLADKMYDLFKNFLVFNPVILNTNPNATYTDSNGQAHLIGTGVHDTWQMMLNFSNVILILFFLVMIFSQITSLGIDNYGLKKSLPKLIIAAVLINLSFLICQVAVDLSNIVGSSIQGIFDGIINATYVGTNVASGTWSGGTWTSMLGGIALAVASAAAVLLGALSVAIPALIAVIIGLLLILFILIGRQAIIILLIVVAPLAIVAYISPNSNGVHKFYDLWKKTFTSMLLLFPIVTLIYGASKLSSAILLPVFSMSSDPTVRTIGEIAANAITVLPLFMVPSVLKKSLDGIGNIGATINQLGSKTGSALGKQGGKVYGNSRLAQLTKYQADKRASDRSLVQSGAYAGGNIYKRGKSRLNKAFNNGPLSGKFGDRSAAAGVMAANKVEDEQVANAITLIKSDSTPVNRLDFAQTKLKEAIKDNDVVKARAAQSILLSSGSPGIRKVRETISGITENSSNRNTLNSMRSDINAAGLKSKDNILSTWGYDSKKVTDANGVERTVGVSMAELIAKPSVLGNLTDTELASQDVSVFEANRGNGLTPEKARSILSNPNLQSLIGTGTEKERILKSFRDGNGYPPDPNANTNGGGI